MVLAEGRVDVEMQEGLACLVELLRLVVELDVAGAQ